MLFNLKCSVLFSFIYVHHNECMQQGRCASVHAFIDVFSEFIQFDSFGFWDLIALALNTPSISLTDLEMHKLFISNFINYPEHDMQSKVNQTITFASFQSAHSLEFNVALNKQNINRCE